jgi:bacteriorhodopsin
MTTITVLNLMTPPRSVLHLTSLQVASFVALTAAVHYYMESHEDDHLRRTVIRFVDWIVTAPLMRLQIHTLQGTATDLVLHRMFLSTQTFMVLSLWAELSSHLEVQFVLTIIGLLVANYSLVIVENPSTAMMNRITRIIMIAYTVVYLGLIGGHKLWHVREIMFAIMDAMVKSVFITWLITHHRQVVG